MREQAEQPEQPEGGFVIIVLLTLLVPMLLVVGAFSVTMTGRTNELNVEMDEERALLVAEAGVDDAIFKAQNLNLLNGQTYVRTLSAGLSYKTVVTYLQADGLDNDGDTAVDEPDEDVYQVVVTGYSRNTRRRIAAYLGPVPALDIEATAVATQNPAVEIDLRGSSEISGHDVDLSGASTGTVKVGLSIESPGTVAHLDSEVTGGEESKVVGAVTAPYVESIGLAAKTVDLTVLVPLLQNAANLVLTSDRYSAYNFGNGPAGISNIAYREGNVKFAGASQGAGILVVTGDLEVTGNFKFWGVIIVLGNLLNSAGTAEIYGSIIQGPSGGMVQGKGTLKVQYSADAVDLANNSGATRYVAFNGWQELSR